jgi:SAM-dependent methyltransferase
MTVSPQWIKACCADAYGSDIVALLLGESYHPGGAALTRRVADQIGLLGLDQIGALRRVADIACGRGATARLLAGEYHVTVDGVDASAININHARAAAAQGQLQQRVRFHHGDAEELPLPDNTFDALLCECAFCTFPDKNTAAREFARILRPGGRAGIADVTVTDAGLPADLTTFAARIACIADARTVSDYTAILAGAGLQVGRIESHDHALLRMIDRIEARITALRIAVPAMPADQGVEPDPVLAYSRLARDAVEAGHIGYALIIADKP